MLMFTNPDDQEIRNLLARSRTIAVVGLSGNPGRDSYRVSRYMQEQGYRIIPVNPNLKDEVLGEKPYASLAEIPGRVDIVNIFRRAPEVPQVVREAIPLKPEAIWIQLDIVSEEAAEIAAKEGITVVMDRCIKVEHCRLLGER